MKPIFNPSRLQTYAKCKLKYFVNYVKNLEALPNVHAARELGTFGHAAESAHDSGQGVQAALARALKSFKTKRGYTVKHSGILEQLKVEAYRIYTGSEWADAKGNTSTSEGYESWCDRELEGKGAEFVEGSIEKRLFVDIGPVILAPKIDAALETFEWLNTSKGSELWSYERKYTSKWQDKNWENRWKMEVQSTMQGIAIEKHYDTPCVGHMLQGVQFSRQNRQNVEEPQQIMRVQRLPLKWVVKPAGIKAHFLAWMEALPGELAQRKENNDWPADGTANGSCDFCDLRVYCIDGSQQLVPREVDDVDKKEGRK